MKTKGGLLAAVLSAAATAASLASAATVDLTDLDTYDTRTALKATGTLSNGVMWMITSPSGRLTYTRFDGIDSPLRDQRDGIGVKDDEISYIDGESELLYLQFSKKVTVTGFHFMDLFEEPGVPPQHQEMALIYVGQFGMAGLPDLTFGADTAYALPASGYRFGSANVTASRFTFAVSEDNDGEGVPDYALAGFDVEPAVVPLPAGILLLGSGVASLMTLRRRRV